MKTKAQKRKPVYQSPEDIYRKQAQQVFDAEAARLVERVSGLMLDVWRKAVGYDERTWDDAAHNFYRYTDCGPTVQARPGNLVLTCSVEGVEQMAGPITLDWPFSRADVRRAVRDIQNDAKYIWDETHGCSDCGDPDDFNGIYRRIDPKCKTCNGDGVIL